MGWGRGLRALQYKKVTAHKRELNGSTTKDGRRMLGVGTSDGWLSYGLAKALPRPKITIQVIDR